MPRGLAATLYPLGTKDNTCLDSVSVGDTCACSSA